MPEVAWFPEPPNPNIRLRMYDEEDWVWMNNEGSLGIRQIGTKYVTFPIIPRNCTPYIPPKLSRRERISRYFTTKRSQLGWWLINESDDDS